MNVQHTERENKWLVANLRKLAHAQAAILRLASKKSPDQGRSLMELKSIAIYYIATLSIFPLFYGFYDSDYEYYAGAYNASVYFLTCALVPLICLLYVAMSLQFANQNATRITKSLSVVYFVLLVNNVVMSIDSYENLETWIALDYVDTLINGKPDWLIPLGAADVAFILIGVACLASRFTSLED